MRKQRQLLDSEIRALKPGVSKEWTSDGDGLYIRLWPSGVKSFVLRRKIKGRTKRTTLGQYPKMSLREARLAAAAERMKDGEKKTEAYFGSDTPGTFGELIDKYYAEQIEPRYKDPRQVRLYKDNRVPDWLKGLVVTSMTPDDARAFRVRVRDWLVEYANTSGPVGANRLLSILKQTTRFGANIGYIEVDPLIGLTKKYVGGDEKPRERILSDDEIRALWSSESGHTPILKFLLLTGQRIGEAQGARRSDFTADRWHIPADRTKNGKAHWVPLTAEIKSILEDLPADGDFMFPTRSITGTQAWLRRWCDRESISPRFTPHDLRRTMVTRMNDLQVEPYIVEKLVNHSMAGVMAVYNRAEYTEERVKAARIWSTAVDEIVNTES